MQTSLKRWSGMKGIWCLAHEMAQNHEAHRAPSRRVMVLSFQPHGLQSQSLTSSIHLTRIIWDTRAPLWGVEFNRKRKHHQMLSRTTFYSQQREKNPSPGSRGGVIRISTCCFSPFQAPFQNRQTSHCVSILAALLVGTIAWLATASCHFALMWNQRLVWLVDISIFRNH